MTGKHHSRRTLSESTQGALILLSTVVAMTMGVVLLVML